MHGMDITTLDQKPRNPDLALRKFFVLFLLLQSVSRVLYVLLDAVNLRYDACCARMFCRLVSSLRSKQSFFISF